MKKNKKKFEKVLKGDKFRKNVLLVVILVLVLGGLYFYSQSLGSSEVSDVPGVSDIPDVSSPVDVEPVPEKINAPAPSERGQSFTVSSSDKSGPRLVSFFIDPYDPEIGEEQLGSVHVKDSEPVTSVVMMINTDNKSETYELELVYGTELDGYWQGSWIIDDTNDEVYEIPISATSSRGTSEIHVTLK